MQPKILLVDDREDNLLSLRAILEPEHYKCVNANSGREALRILLQEFDFALILMDVNMPNLNGFETASLIYEREKLKQIPIIFLTAHNYGEGYVFKGYRTGAVDYLYKPINPELLKAKVSVFVELYRKNQKLVSQEQKLHAINKNLQNEINERKLSEAKVKDLNLELLKNIDQLEATNKDLDRFAFMASHDLQEPLRKIRMFSDRLFYSCQESLTEDAKAYVKRIQASAERMQALICDILTFSKMTSDKEGFVACDLNQLIQEVLLQMDETIKEKNARVITDVLPTLTVKPSLIQPLFNNLVSNALKYSKKDTEPVIMIRAENSAPANGDSVQYCRIYVQDNGIGFEQKYAEHIFNMFARLHSATEYEGTGIGLALCKKIVDDHQGFITAKSKVNEGSTFIVSLPRDLNQGLG